MPITGINKTDFFALLIGMNKKNYSCCCYIQSAFTTSLLDLTSHSQTTTLSLDLLNIHSNPHLLDKRLTRQSSVAYQTADYNSFKSSHQSPHKISPRPIPTTFIFKTPCHTKGSRTHHDYHNANDYNITTRHPHAHGTLLRCISLYSRFPLYNLRHCVEECVHRARSTSLLSQKLAGAEEDIGSLY